MNKETEKVRSSLKNKTHVPQPDMKFQMKKINFKFTKEQSSRKNLIKIDDVSLNKYPLAKCDLYFQDNVLQNNHKKKDKITSLFTKSETIISKLKLLRQKAKNANDTISLNDIEWIISVINDKNLYDIDTNDFKSTIKNDKNQNGLDYLMQYSHLQTESQQAKDFKVMRATNKDYYSSSNLKSCLVGHSTPKHKNSIHSGHNSLSFSSMTENIVNNQLELIDSTQFDIFSLNQMQNEQTGILIATTILSEYDFIQNGIIDNDILNNFIEKVVHSYDRNNVPYHNDLHATDVMQTLYTMITRGSLKKKMSLENLDTFSILVGAFCHDLKHTGQNNTYHINSRSKIAMRYNDISVLENYHSAQTFKLLSKPEYDIFINFKIEEYRIIRRRIIEGILSTDMANHQKVLLNAKGKIEKFNIKEGKNFELIFKVDTDKLFDEQQNILNLCLHCADVSNPAKPSQISKQWTTRVYDEFFKQGDLEKENGLPVSLLCDRKTTNINKAMIGFINFVVVPSFDLLTVLIPEVSFYSENIRINKNYYEMESKASEANSNDEESDNSESSQSD